MTQTLPPSPTAAEHRDARPLQPSTPALREQLEEVITLGTGLGVGLLPGILLSVPGIVLFVALPAILLLVVTVPFAVLGAALAAPVVAARRLRRRRRRLGIRASLSASGRAVS
jgi:hypothetical protein